MAMTEKEKSEGMRKALDEQKKKAEIAKTPLGALEAMKKKKKEMEEALKY